MKNRLCENCEDEIPRHILAGYPEAIYCCTGCHKDGEALAIYGDTKRERQNGARLERELAAVPKKPKTILRRAGA